MRSIAARRGKTARIFANAEQKWGRGYISGWSQIRERPETRQENKRRKASLWSRASQPIVSEFVYDDSALSKKFLWLTSTSSTRNTKVNPLFKTSTPALWSEGRSLSHYPHLSLMIQRKSIIFREDRRRLGPFYDQIIHGEIFEGQLLISNKSRILIHEDPRDQS